MLGFFLRWSDTVGHVAAVAATEMATERSILEIASSPSEPESQRHSHGHWHDPSLPKRSGSLRTTRTAAAASRRMSMGGPANGGGGLAGLLRMTQTQVGPTGRPRTEALCSVGQLGVAAVPGGQPE